MKGKARRWVAFASFLMACGNDATTTCSKCGGQNNEGGGLRDLCATRNARPVGWDDQTPLGMSPAEAFSALGGTCTTALTWDSTPEDDLDVVPPSGTSNVRVKVDVDHESVMLITPDSSAPSYCTPSLQVKAAVHVDTDDGTFAESATAQVRHDASGLGSVTFMENASDIGGALSVKPKHAGTSVQLSYEIGPFASGCVGDIRLETFSSSGNMGTGSSGTFASWSNTSCKTGEVPVSLDAGLGSAPSLASEATQAFGNATLSGTWDDGTSTDLTLSVDMLPSAGCGEQNVLNHELDKVSIPAKVTYRTSDGRVASHTANATLIALGRTLELETSEDASCDSNDGKLFYSAADCSSLSRINVQLFLNDTAGIGGAPDARSGTLTVYEYGKNASPDTSSADAVHTLTF